jgi:insertion element IS1 protein InsB
VVDIVYFASDYWESYEEFITKEKHLQTKAQRYTIEGYNSRIRYYLAISGEKQMLFQS